jgi:hypothetical protein
METIQLKRKLYQHCQQLLQDRIDQAREAYRDAQEAAQEESKSGGGDQEPGSSMMLQEMDKHGQYLSDTVKLKSALDQLDVYEKSDEVLHGSLVYTNHGAFYIAISLGNVKLDNKQYFLVSSTSPIAVKMIGLNAGSKFELNGRQFVVEDIC